MTRIYGKPDEFVATGLRAFGHIFQDLVRPVAGGALRAQPGRQGKVAVLGGGGSGHYPAFCGYVGEGLLMPRSLAISSRRRPRNPCSISPGLRISAAAW